MIARVDESPGVASRRAAVSLIEGLFLKGRDFEDPMAAEALSKLTARDRGFARRLAITVTRHRGTLESLLKAFMARPPKGKARRILPILQIGAAELLFLKAPAHAVVDSAVSLTKAEGLASMAGLVNAVLRRTIREGQDWLQAVDQAQMDLPPWLWEDWKDRLGEPTTRAIHSNLQAGVPPLDLTCPKDPDGWSKRLKGTRIGSNTIRLAHATAVTDLEGYQEGAWWVQDFAATLPVNLMGSLAGKTVIDLCAAPGGKTAQLIASGAAVTALDRAAGRLERLRQNLNRLGFKAEGIVEADALKWRPETPVDAVLLDAPCSATGTLRRHPEIAHRRTSEDVAKLAKLQKQLIPAAMEMLKPGGTLVVATCSLQTEESKDLHAYALEQPSLTCLPIKNLELDDLPKEAFQTDGSLLTHPGLLSEKGGMDGFFVGRYQRR